MADFSPVNKSGCGLLNAVFGKIRRSSSTSSIPTQVNGTAGVPTTATAAATTISAGATVNKAGSSGGLTPKRRRNSSDDLFGQDQAAAADDKLPPGTGASGSRSKIPPTMYQQQQQQYGNVRNINNNYNNNNVHQQQQQSKAQAQQGGGKKTVTTKDTLGLSGELESIIAEHQKAKGGNAHLVRASSGNVMLYGHLGNLRQPNQLNPQSSQYSNGNYNNNRKGGGGGGYGQMPNGTTASATTTGPTTTTTRYANSGMGNIVKRNGGGGGMAVADGYSNDNKNNPLCRALSCRMDPEELKILGNEDYKNGRFAEALAMYERAVDLDPTKAAYRSNMSAALSALGRLLEAVFECREAIKIEPQYHRAHLRLANLCLRLGEPDSAMYHFKQAGPEADPDVNAKAKMVLAHLKKCDEAKRLRDWNTVLKETANALSAGADSAPMILALQSEAYLKLHRHQDADLVLENSPDFEVEHLTKFFGPAGNATLLLIRAQVDLASGRFDEAMAAAQLASQLDPSNRELNSVMRRTRAVVASRSRGNDLFKALRFSEACVAYSEGLEHDPYNSLLLCNRAACRSKLGQHEKAIEDCNAALNVRPSYTKARLRKADCNFKLGKLEAAVRDYEMLIRESPGDEEVGRALFEALVELKKQGGEDVSGMRFGKNEVVKVQSNEQFRHCVTSPGLCIALFCNKPGDRQSLQFMDQLCKTYPTMKFIKVEVEDHSYIAKSEGVMSSLPTFKIYRNGLMVKEVPGNDHELLERSIKEHTS